MEGESTIGQRPGRREVGERATRQIVDHVDAPVLGEQPVDEGRADESRAARDQRLHAGAPYSRSAGTRPPEIRVPDGMVTPSPTIVSAARETSGLRTA